MDAIKLSVIEGHFKHARITQNQIECCEKTSENFQCEDADFQEFWKIFHCENVTFADFVAVDNNLEVCDSHSNLDIAKRIHNTCNKDSEHKTNRAINRPHVQQSSP